MLYADRVKLKYEEGSNLENTMRFFWCWLAMHCNEWTKLLWSGTSIFWSTCKACWFWWDLIWKSGSSLISPVTTNCTNRTNRTNRAQIGANLGNYSHCSICKLGQSRPKKLPSQMEMFSDMCSGGRFLFLFGRFRFSFFWETPCTQFQKVILKFLEISSQTLEIEVEIWELRDLFESWGCQCTATTNSFHISHSPSFTDFDNFFSILDGLEFS